jgi:hypothetical protein
MEYCHFFNRLVNTVVLEYSTRFALGLFFILPTKYEEIWSVRHRYLYEVTCKCVWWSNSRIQAYIPPTPPQVRQPLAGPGLLIIEASPSHSDTSHSVGLLWTSGQPDPETSTWQQTTFTTDIHAPGGIRIRNPSMRAAADPRLRRCCHWKWYGLIIIIQISNGKLTYMKYIKTMKWNSPFSSDIFDKVLSFINTHRNKPHTDVLVTHADVLLFIQLHTVGFPYFFLHI